MGRDFRSALERCLDEFNIRGLSAAQLDRLEQHYALLVKWNSRVNLTRLIGPDEAARFHYAESLFGGTLAGGAHALLDIGSGAGFPAVPLAVLLTEARVTGLEVNQKKALFLNEVKDELNLTNFTVVRARVEDHDLSGYDLLTSRALDRAGSLLPAIVGALGDGQRLMLFCGPELQAELAAQFAGVITTTVHPVPRTEARLVVFISRA